MKLSDNLYRILKWLDLIVIPAAATFYKVMASIWGWPLGDEVVATAAAVCTFLGAIIGISTAEYYMEQ